MGAGVSAAHGDYDIDRQKCNVKSVCVLAAVPRATFYRTYPHLKAEFDRRRSAAQDNGQQPDSRHACIDRLKSEITELRTRLIDRDREIAGLTRFRDTALSRLTAQHDEIIALRCQLRAGQTNVRSLRR
jgi:NAD-dependent SIR2 family protein deacetylase